ELGQGDHVRGAIYYSFDMRSPSFERGLLVGKVFVPIVNSGDAADFSSRMVENLVDDVRGDAEPSHSGRGTTAEVVESKRFYFGSTELGHCGGEPPSRMGEATD